MKNQARSYASPCLYAVASFLCATAALAGQDSQTPEPQQIAYRLELPSTGMGFHHELRFPLAKGLAQRVTDLNRESEIPDLYRHQRDRRLGVLR